MKKTVRTIVIAAVLSAAIAIAGMPMPVLALEENGIVDATEEAGEERDIAEADREPDMAASQNTPDGETMEETQPAADEQESDPVDIPGEDAGEGSGKIEENGDAALPMETSPVTVAVPIYNYDIVNVVVPTSYMIALNPYELAIGLGDGTTSTAQVVSKNYGIVNKSSRDKVVTVRLTIEDLNGGRITFVNSAEEAMNADADTYAVYLAAVPADASGVRLGDVAVDRNVQAESLANVNMTKAENGAIALKAGENSFAFKLSRGVYGFADGRDITLEDSVNPDAMGQIELTDLAADSKGATAFTFVGTMNPQADWSKLSGGLKISVVYLYENATGDESIAEGTGALIAR